MTMKPGRKLKDGLFVRPQHIKQIAIFVRPEPNSMVNGNRLGPLFQHREVKHLGVRRGENPDAEAGLFYLDGVHPILAAQAVSNRAEIKRPIREMESDNRIWGAQMPNV